MLYFHFLGILGILDPVMAILSWDPRDLGYQAEVISMAPVDKGSCVSDLSCGIVDLGCCTTIMPLYIWDPCYPMRFCFWCPKMLRCVTLYRAGDFI